MKKSTAGLEDSLRAHLKGYGRKDRAALDTVVNYTSWSMVAVCERERRVVQFIQSLPIAEVEAIAQRKINLNELARQARVELDQE